MSISEVLLLIGLIINSIVLGIKIMSDKKNNKEDEGTGNPHYCIHEGWWGEVKADIRNIKTRLDKLNV